MHQGSVPLNSFDGNVSPIAVGPGTAKGLESIYLNEVGDDALYSEVSPFIADQSKFAFQYKGKNTQTLEMLHFASELQSAISHLERRIFETEMNNQFWDICDPPNPSELKSSEPNIKAHSARFQFTTAAPFSLTSITSPANQYITFPINDVGQNSYSAPGSTNPSGEEKYERVSASGRSSRCGTNPSVSTFADGIGAYKTRGRPSGILNQHGRHRGYSPYIPTDASNGVGRGERTNRRPTLHKSRISMSNEGMMQSTASIGGRETSIGNFCGGGSLLRRHRRGSSIPISDRRSLKPNTGHNLTFEPHSWQT